MAIFLIILSCLLWGLSIWFLFTRQILAPVSSFVALALLSLAKSGEGYPILPLNGTILLGWFLMTVVVTAATILQPEPIRRQTRGMGYITAGAIVGMAIGLLGVTVTASPAMLYGIMIVATAAGIFFGFLLFSRTPAGEGVAPGSGNFFRYLLAKGFPTAIAVMQGGVALTLLLAVSHIH